MTGEQFVAFLIFSVVAAITPGPSNVILIAAGAIDGFVKGLRTVAGIMVGMGVMMFVVTFGMGQAVLDHPRLMLSMKFAGAAFLLWLAYRIAISGSMQPGGDQKTVGFVGAAALQWVNPKSWLVCTSAAGTYLSPQAGSAITQALALASTFILAALPCALLWLGLGATLQHWLRTERSSQRFNIAMAVLLAGSVAFVF